MRCIVTAGPTWEPLDQVRRLTNFSTGSLGGRLANALALAGHDVRLLLSETATWRAPLWAVSVAPFSTGESLAEALRQWSGPDPTAVFHAAAVGDFAVRRLSTSLPDGTLQPATCGKVDTRGGVLVAELEPTPKILGQLRSWFPNARITGWKYEADGTRADAVARGEAQMAEARTDACVVNGPACGTDFVWLRRDAETRILTTRDTLLDALVASV